ncbi:MAG: hypothetical protein A4E73_02848 [Syntrophaceae bacterium PtaU1.Bin231]|nr:MAG: hypothetical protein A4E73_02848 [Syntrophaceae bacterium PtaU1.Bin231]
MARKGSFMLVLVFLFLFASVAAHAAEQKRGQPPRPAVKCHILDLDVKPATLHRDAHIESFTVRYLCEHGDRRNVDIEILRDTGFEKKIVAVLRDTILKEGENKVSLKGAGRWVGPGTFITSFKSNGTEFQHRASPLRCVEWALDSSVPGLEKDCETHHLSIDPVILKRGTKIKFFHVDYACKQRKYHSDIEIQMKSGSRVETVAVLRNIDLLYGNHSVTLSGTGSFDGDVREFRTTLSGNWGRHQFITPLKCSGWGVK